MNILVVEDDGSCVDFLRTLINNVLVIEANTIAVASLASAIAAIEGTKYDIVILDLSLPDSEPQDTLSKLLPTIQEIPTVIWTGAASLLDGIAAIEAGAVACVPKPQMEPLRTALEAAYRLATANQAATA